MAEPKGLAAMLQEQDAQWAAQDEYKKQKMANYKAYQEQAATAAAMQEGDYDTERFGEVDTSMGEYQSAAQNLGRRGVETGAAILRGRGQIRKSDTGETGYWDDAAEVVGDIGKMIDVNPLQQGHMQDIAGGLGSSAPFMAGQVVAGGLTGLATRSPKAATAAGSGAAAYMGQGAMMDEMVQDYRRTMGKDPSQEELQVMAKESRYGWAEAAPIGHGFGRAVGALGKTTDGVIKHAAKTGAIEGAEEFAQEAGLGVIKNKVAKEKLAYDEDRSLLEGVIEEGAMGGEVGFIMGATMSLLGARSRGKQRMYDEALANAAEEETLSPLDQATKSVNEGLAKSVAERQAAEAAGRKEVAEEAKAKKAEKDKAASDKVVDAAVQNIPPEDRNRGVQATRPPLQTEAAKKVRAARQAREQAGVKPTQKQQVADKVNSLPNVSPKVKEASTRKANLRVAEPRKTADPEVAEVAKAVAQVQKEPVVQGINSIPPSTGNPVQDAETVVTVTEQVSREAIAETVDFDTTPATQTVPPVELTEKAPDVVTEEGTELAPMEKQKTDLMKELTELATTMGKEQNRLDYTETDPIAQEEYDKLDEKGKTEEDLRRQITGSILSRRQKYAELQRKLKGISMNLQRERAKLDPEFKPKTAAQMDDAISKWASNIINENKLRVERDAGPEAVDTKSEEEMKGVQTMNELDNKIAAYGKQFEGDPIAESEALLKNRSISIPKLKVALKYMGVSFAAREKKPSLMSKYILHSRKYKRNPRENLKAIVNLVKHADKTGGMTRKVQAEYDRIYGKLYGAAMDKFAAIEDPDARKKAARDYVENRIDEVAYGKEQLGPEEKDALAEEKANEIIKALEAKGMKVTGDGAAVLLGKVDEVPDEFVADNLPMAPADVEAAKKRLEGMFVQTIKGQDGTSKTMVRIPSGSSLTVPWQEVAAYGEAVADGSLGIRITGGGKMGTDKFTLRIGKLTNPQTQLVKHPLSNVKGIRTEDYVTKDEIKAQLEFDEQEGVMTEEEFADEFGMEEGLTTEQQDVADFNADISDGGANTRTPRVRNAANTAGTVPQGVTQGIGGQPDPYEEFQMDQTADRLEREGTIDGLPVFDTADEGQIMDEDFMGGPPGKPSEGAAPPPKSSKRESIVDSIEDAQLYAVTYDELSPEDRQEISRRIIIEQNSDKGGAEGILSTVNGDEIVFITPDTQMKAGHLRQRIIRTRTAEELGSISGQTLESQVKGQGTWVIASQLKGKAVANAVSTAEADAAKKKKLDDEANALAKEVRDLENDDYVVDDDLLFNTITARGVQEQNKRLAVGSKAVLNHIKDLPLERRIKSHDILKILSKSLPDGPEKFLVDKLVGLNLDASFHLTQLPVFRDLNADGSFNNQRVTRGAYGAGQIKMDPWVLEHTPDSISYVFIHEAVHAATRRALVTDKKEAARMLSLFTQVRKLKHKAPSNINPQIFDNMDELLVYSMTNWETMKWLDTIPSMNPETGVTESWLRTFFRHIGKALGLNPKEGMLLKDIMQSGNRLLWEQRKITEARGYMDDMINTRGKEFDDLIAMEKEFNLYERSDFATNIPLRKFIKNSTMKQQFYHYMSNTWDKIDLMRTELGLHIGTELAAKHRMNAIEEQRAGRGEAPKNDAKIERFHVDIRNPMRWKDIGHFGDPATLRKQLRDSYASGGVDKKLSKTFWKDLQDVDMAYRESFRTRPLMKLTEREQLFSSLVRQAFLKEGIDAIVYTNRVEDKGSDSVIVLDPKAIKAAGATSFDKTVDDIYADQEATTTTKNMPPVDVAKAKKFEAQFKKSAGKNGLSVTVLWSGKDKMPATFQKKVNELVDDRNFVRLANTRGWINLKTKEVILFPQNMASAEEFKRTMLHEVIGHFSMEQMFGENFNKFLDNMASNAHWKPLIRQKMADYNTTRKESEWISERTAAKEIIARMAEDGTPNKGLYNRVIAWFKHQLRRFGMQDVSENDVLNYIRQASKNFEGGTLPTHDFYGDEVMSLEIQKAITGGMVSDLNIREHKGTMRGVIDMLIKNKVADIDELSGTAWAKSVKPTWDKVSKSKYFNWYSHLQGMDFQKTYQYVRQLGLGISSNYDRRAAHIFKNLQKLTGDQKSQLHHYFTTAGAELPNDWGTQQQVEIARDAKQVIFELGEELVDFEYLNPDTFAANADSYLPRMYLAFVIDPQKAAAIYGGGSKVSLQNYLKEIKIKLAENGENAAEIAEIEKSMGLIDDPVMLATNSIAMVGRDVALLQMLEGISYASEQMGGKTWAVPKMKGLKLPGMVKPKDPMTILQEIEDNRKNVLSYTRDSRKATTKRLYDVQETAAREALRPYGLADVDINEYKYIETSKRNGALSGRWIREEIYDDIRASYVAFASEDPSKFEAVFGQYSGLTKANRIWKNTKTVWNMPTHARNFVGNFVNLDISTATPTYKLMGMVQEEMVKFWEATVDQTPVSEMDYWWQVADKLGITETTFTAQEAQTALREWKKAVRSGDDWTQGIPNNKAMQFVAKKMPMMTQKGAKMADLMGGMYQASETLFKVVKLRDTIQRYEAQMGVDLANMPDAVRRDAIESMAVQDAQKWIFDYSAVPRTVRYLRNAPIGAPFISFAYLALPRMFEAAAKHPAKVTQYTMAPFVLGHIAAMLGAFPEDDDDWNKVKAKLPDYMKDKYSILPLPWKDEYGNRTFVDIGYFIPFSPYIEAGRAYTAKFITNTKPDMPLTDPILNMGIISGPTPDLITAWKTGMDSFTGRPIIDPYGSPTDKMVDGLNYAWTMAAPTFLTEKGWAGKTIQYLTDANKNFNNRTGERKEDLVSSQLRMFGVNTTSPNLKDSRRTNLRYMESEINKIKAASNREVKQARGAGASRQQLADIRKSYADKLKLYRTNAANYRKESR